MATANAKPLKSNCLSELVGNESSEISEFSRSYPAGIASRAGTGSPGEKERGIPSLADALTRAAKRRALTICSQQAQRTRLRPAELHAHVLSGDICARSNRSATIKNLFD